MVDILAIMFFIFGCIFKVKGLVITSLILSVIVIAFSLFDKRTSKESQKKQTVRLIGLACEIILFGSAIIRLCIW